MSRSPFPGMDPYLERHPDDIQTSLASGARTQLNNRLPADLAAIAQERIAVGASRTEISENPAELVVVAPFRLSVARADPIIERLIHVIEAGSERLVTVIEFLSPTNKRRPGIRAFRRKRVELLKAGVNVVEVDLIRRGDWEALLRPHRCPDKAKSPYRVTFRVPRDRRAVYLHPISLRSPLPSIPIPLRARDPEVKLDLQPLLDAAYMNGRYDRRLQLAYTKPPDPPLDSDDVEWADSLLADKRR